MARNGEAGVALVVVTMAVSLLLALGTTLVLTTMIETAIATNYRDGVGAFYAADAGVERVLPDLAAAPDWDAALDGTIRSTFADGPPAGTRTLDGAALLDLTRATNLLRCGRISACSEAEMNAVTAERPWGRNNPRWQLFAYGPATGLLPPGEIDSSFYLVVWIGDDPSENDGNPIRDGQPPAVVDSRNPENPGRGLVTLVAHGYGRGGARRALEVTVARAAPWTPGPVGVRVLAWREIR